MISADSVPAPGFDADIFSNPYLRSLIAAELGSISGKTGGEGGIQTADGLTTERLR
jgi:hypothetical protein